MSAAEAGSGVVLFVDDERDLLDVAHHILRNQGLQPVMADSGEKAIQIIQEEEARIDAAVVDLNMPGMGGLRCVEKIKEVLPDLPVFVSTGYLTSEDKERLVSLGVIGFFEKPYRFESLVSEVKKVVG